MSTDPARPAKGDLTMARTAFDTRAAFAEQLQAALDRAQREVWMADRDLGDWPLASLPFVDAMQDFLRRSAANHLRVLVVDAAGLERATRFATVMRTHAHHAQCRVVPEHASSRFGEACSMLVVDRSWIVRRFHRDQPRGAAELDPSAARPWLDQLEMLWEESVPGLSSTTLGLG